MENNEDVMLYMLCAAQVAVLCIKLHVLRRRRARRWWVRPLLRGRPVFGFYYTGLNFMRDFDQEEFFQYTRMNRAKLDELVCRVSPFLRKTSIRRPLPCELRVALTLA